MALGLPIKSEEAKAILESTLEDTKNDAVLAALKGTSFEYEAGKRNGEGPAVLSEMLTEETEAVKSALDNWKDLVDMLLDASDEDADKSAVLAEYSEALTTLMGTLPDTDMNRN